MRNREPREEAVGDLQGETLDRVIEHGDVKLYRARATLFDWTGKHECRHPYSFEVPVPIFEDSKQVGAASIHVTRNRVIADLTFDYATSSRLLAQIEEPVYAIPNDEADYEIVGDPTGEYEFVVDYVTVSALFLSRSPSLRAGGLLEPVTII